MVLKSTQIVGVYKAFETRGTSFKNKTVAAKRRKAPHKFLWGNFQATTTKLKILNKVFCGLENLTQHSIKAKNKALYKGLYTKIESNSKTEFGVLGGLAAEV